MKTILSLFLLLLLAGCGQAYRYPCQDPANWDKDFCKKPICEVNRDCPEHVFKEGPAQPPANRPVPRGECK